MFVQLRPLQDLRYQSAASGYQLDDAAGWRRAQVRADLDLPTMLEITHHCLEVPFSWSTDQAYICILSSNQHAMHWGPSIQCQFIHSRCSLRTAVHLDIHHAIVMTSAFIYKYSYAFWSEQRLQPRRFAYNIHGLYVFSWAALSSIRGTRTSANDAPRRPSRMHALS
jgi:hypothetical protein